MRGARVASDRDVRALLGFLVPTLVAATAAAEPDGRPSDRVFFGASAGVVDREVPTGGYETSWWPTDYVGVATVVTLVGGDAPRYDLGGELVFGVPLRWIQPYAGALAGYRTTATTIAPRVHLVGGVNVYAHRDVRVFVELRDPAITVFGDDHAPQAVLGVRWSPDWFQRARPVTKVDAVWWSTLLAAGLWTGATLAH